MGKDPVRVVQDNGGCATTREVLEHATRWALRKSVDSGRLMRAGRGVYVLPALPDARVVAAELGGLASHLSAAMLWRLDMVREPDAVHVTVRHGTTRAPRDGVVVHHTRHLEADDLRRGRTSLTRTVLDCAATLPFAEALAVADSALKYGLTHGDLLMAATGTPGPSRSRCLRVATFADQRSANAFESLLRGHLIEAGITSFVPQWAIRAGGRTVHADLADPLAGVALEADSFEFHGTRAEFRRDCERYDELVAAGWTVLRLPWELVMFDPDRVVRLVREAVSGGRGGSSERTVPT